MKDHKTENVYFYYALIDRDGVVNDNAMEVSVSDCLTGPQTTFTVIIIPVPTRPGNWGTCSVGQVIRTTLKDASIKWMRLGSVVPTFPFPALDEKSQMTLMGFEPKTFRPTIRNANHYAAGSRYCGEFSLANFAHSVTFVQPEIVQLVGPPLSLSRSRCEEKRKGGKHDVDGTLNYALATVPSPPS